MFTQNRLLSLVASAGFVTLSAACGSDGSSSPAAPSNVAATDDGALASVSDSGSGGGDSGGGGGDSIRVRCERRGTNRSKISVDGRNLAPGRYTAHVTSGANSATSPPRRTVGDEVEFDFDSNTGEGGTRISPTFIQGRTVTGQIRNASGAVVRNATARCEVR